ncbi:MAG TPA: hypothetical protein VFF30_01840 [Nitrososphaerales archaeon]|nr:hypothetical protein [Nitrososphaerales archaeon]
MTEHRKRGLASASKEDRRRVAVLGGNAHHEVRGLQGADPETRTAVAKLGGFARAAARRNKLEQEELAKSSQPLELKAIQQPQE